MPSASSAFVLQPSIEHARLYGGQIDGVHIQDWNTGQALPPNGRRRMFYDAEKTEMLDSREQLGYRDLAIMPDLTLRRFQETLLSQEVLHSWQGG